MSLFSSYMTKLTFFLLSQQNIDNKTQTQTLQYTSLSISEFQHYQAF